MTILNQELSSINLAEIHILKKRWAEYKKTGEFIPGHEVTAWIESLPED